MTATTAPAAPVTPAAPKVSAAVSADSEKAQNIVGTILSELTELGRLKSGKVALPKSIAVFTALIAQSEAAVADNARLRKAIAGGQIRCSRCEGEGQLWADGLAHHPSHQGATNACPNCGGSGHVYNLAGLEPAPDKKP